MHEDKKTEATKNNMLVAFLAVIIAMAIALGFTFLLEYQNKTVDTSNLIDICVIENKSLPNPREVCKSIIRLSNETK